ncbi:MAG: hypothetical protein K0M50_05765 [Prolixibacteraceae bacterium]|nr:hypothetical protein [Prolixibacteraceae bacterium]
MKKKFLIVSIIVCIMAQTVMAQKGIRINYYKPYQYKELAGQLVAKAWLSANEMEVGSSVSLDGKEIKTIKVDSGKVDLFLPMVGKAGELVFYSRAKSNKKILLKQIFTPLVSSDWGYFGKGTVNIICSSHQDIAWMNTPDSCRSERIHDIIIPALNLIDKNPAFKFEMEQTLNLMEVLDEVPSEKQRIIKACKNGQFTWGATFNQPYEGLESGEQLVRQSYFGRKWIKDNLPGMDALAAYNVDVPGRSLQFPQMLQKSGIKYLSISRMKEGFYNWFSHDGFKIQTYSPGNYGRTLLAYKYFEEDAITAMQKLNKVMQNWNEYYSVRNISSHYSIVICTDAGGSKDYTTLINEWNDLSKKSDCHIPLLPHSTAEFNMGWYKLIYPDHGWGGKHGEITDSIFRTSREDENKIGEKTLKNSLLQLSSHIELKTSNNIIVFNDLSWDRNGIATTDISDRKGLEWIISDTNGKTAPSKIAVTGNQKIISFEAENVPSIDYQTFYLKKGVVSSDHEIKAGSNYYENKFYTIKFGPGGISRFFGKEQDKQVLI